MGLTYFQGTRQISLQRIGAPGSLMWPCVAFDWPGSSGSMYWYWMRFDADFVHDSKPENWCFPNHSFTMHALQEMNVVYTGALKSLQRI